ncbi:hypothetical protein ACSXC4_12665 [Clostridium perfringens]|uniref:hypothetical protein n=1 Tax=Clostridium perfringens TaxID=1502 RepID=UPI0006C4D3E3|nr:hypothetical protein [Clostridium perfringens]EHK2403630.1 hypothetical protein [Clostridium perfringens]EJT5934378.1 hypothetical protein [Clostridium perfringens]MCS4570046.1 hypothetical protein [Clostridium perfringens]MCX0370653.1 hypothetical protein [Clostridium perfringens]MCX0413345.1 hypothetical protein [Clostridium perfringens]
MRVSMLKTWLEGNESITPQNFILNNKPNFSLGSFIAFDECIDLYKANEFDSGNLDESWNKTRNYIYDALELIGGDIEECGFGYLDREEKYLILNELGEPPLGSYNIYMITIYNDVEEKIVYIGKTDSKKSRFYNGHLAALKLHNPIYDSYKKRVYFGTIVFLDSNANYLPLEYIQPLEFAQNLLGETEKILISYFKPELNRQNVNNGGYEISTIFHIQNFTGTQLFKGDKFICT